MVYGDEPDFTAAMQSLKTLGRSSQKTSGVISIAMSAFSRELSRNFLLPLARNRGKTV